MEEEFEKKSNNKFLKILIPMIILILIIGAGVAYYFMSTTPKNIFTKAVDKIFSNIEEEKFDTLKTNVELSMNIESDNSEIQSIGQMVNNVKIKTNQEIDLNNKIVNEAVSASFLGQDLLNVECIIKDETSYMFLKNIFTKYIEVPLEDIGYEDIFTIMKDIEKIADKEVLAETNKIVKAELKDKTYEQTKEELMINGENVKVTKSTLVLTPEEASNMVATIITNIKDNEKIMNSFENNEEIKTTMKELVNAINEVSSEMVAENGEKIKISIYTKGLKHEAVKFDIDLVDNDQTIGMGLVKVSENNYLLYITQDKTELISISIIDEKKDEKSGTMTFKIDMSNLMQEADSGINSLALIIKGKYNVEYNAKVESPEITDSVKYDEITEEDAMEMYENLQKTELYILLEQSGVLNTSDMYEVSDMPVETLETIETEPEVTAFDYTVKYDVPEGFRSATYNTLDYKYYSDENFNNIVIYINKETKQNYLDLLKEADSLTADIYEEQEISGIKTVTVGNKEFSYRTITYNYYGNKFIDSYFCYEIEEGILYVVETSIQEGTVEDAELNKFLEIQL